jgi:hypothetical protein
LKSIRKQFAEDLYTNKDISDYSKRLAQFRDELFQAEKQFVESRINVINQTVPERQYLILNER